MATQEKETYGVICIILNVTVLISGIVSIYLATSSGKACIERLRGANGDDEETNKNKKKVQVAPAASKKKEEEQEIVQKLKDIRAKFGASSMEYKQAPCEREHLSCARAELAEADTPQHHEN